MPHVEELPNREGTIELFNGDVRDFYGDWQTPVAIVSDGAYGVGAFPGDPPTPAGVREWYEPHVREWSEHATGRTTLWLWNTEIGWAHIHPLLEEYGWEYRGANIWNKGIQHIAGNSNTETMRKFPQVTEVCVQYTKKAEFNVEGETLTAKEWIRHEWERSGLTLGEADDACGVSDAASRKYLTRDHAWYPPPAEAFEKLAEYANEHGNPEGTPYFALGGDVLSGEEWEHRLRAKFDLDPGITNVWEESQVSGDERLTADGGESIHLNQKPLSLVERIIRASTDRGDVVWEPFGGLCTAAVAAKRLGRQCRSAEVIDDYYRIAVKRVAAGDHGAGDDKSQPSLDEFVDG